MSLLMFSCLNQSKQNTFTTIYQFENFENLSEREINTTFEVLKKRFNKFGIKDVSIQLNSRNHVEVKTKSIFTVERLNDLVENQGKLDFWPLYKPDEFFPFIFDANELLKKEVKQDSINPILDLVINRSYQGAPELFFIKKESKELFGSYLNRKNIKALFPLDKKIKFLFGIENIEGTVPVYIADASNNKRAPITEKNIIEARQSFNTIGRPTILIDMDELSALKWEKMTYKAFSEQTNIAITVNGEVYSAPGVASGPIHGGHSEISGDFTIEEAQNFAAILTARQSIPKLKFIESFKANKK